MERERERGREMIEVEKKRWKTKVVSVSPNLKKGGAGSDPCANSARN